MAIKRVTLLGNFAHPFSSEHDYMWTMRERLGLEVTPLQEREATGQQILAAALSSDALFWVHTHNWVTPGLPMRSVLAQLREAGVVSFGYHLDLWLGLEREQQLYADGYLDVDYFFTVDRLMADKLNADASMPRSYFVRPGVVERECLLFPPTSGRYEIDVAFVGGMNYHPEWPYRRQLIEWLHAQYGAQFALYGQDGRGVVRGTRLNMIYGATRVVVGDSLCLNYDYPYYTSDRVYETTGRGGFIIHPYVEGLEEAFVDGKEVVFYQYAQFSELRDKIDYYLAHDAEREAIRLAGYQRTLQDHTYTNRLREIFSILEEERS